MKKPVRIQERETREGNAELQGKKTKKKERIPWDLRAKKKEKKLKKINANVNPKNSEKTQMEKGPNTGGKSALILENPERGKRAKKQKKERRKREGGKKQLRRERGN